MRKPRPAFPITLREFPWMFATEEACQKYLAECHASNLWRRSKPCWDSGPSISPLPIRTCEAGGPFQGTKPKPTPTYWGLLKQPDKQKSAKRRYNPHRRSLMDHGALGRNLLT